MSGCTHRNHHMENQKVAVSPSQTLCSRGRSRPDSSHLCMFYYTDEECRRAVTSFIRRGLEGLEKVIYIADSRKASTILRRLCECISELTSHLGSGQLTLLAPDATYLQGGFFDPANMFEYLEEEMEKALTEGYSALRIAGDMSWALNAARGSDLLIEYESKLNDLLHEMKCRTLCMYDCRQFSPSVLLYILAAHPVIHIGSQMYENFFYRIPPPFLWQNSASRTLSFWLEDLVEHGVIGAA